MEHSSNALYVVGTIALLFGLLHAMHCIVRAPISNIPGPWYSRWSSLVLDYHFIRGTRSFYVNALHLRYGPIVRIGPNEIAFTDHDAVKTIYTTKETFRKADFYRRIVTQDTESLFSTVNIDFHRRHRRLLAGPMAELSLKTLVPQIHARVEFAVQRIREEMESRGAADVLKWWLFLATDVIGELTFGDSFRMLELGHKNAYAQTLVHVGTVSATRAVFPSLVRLSASVPLPFFTKAVKARAELRRYASESLQRYRSLVDKDPSLVQQTLFTKLFMAEADEKMPFNEILDEAELYIGAGSDTTANSLTYLTWSVCRSPEIRDKLAQELQTLPPDFTEANLRQLPFLNCIIDETLRLYPAAPSSLPRVVPAGGTKLAGHWLEAGTVVGTQAYSMHRDPLIFEKPDEFMPSRWVRPTKAMRDTFMPYSRGSRGKA